MQLKYYLRTIYIYISYIYIYHLLAIPTRRPHAWLTYEARMLAEKDDKLTQAAASNANQLNFKLQNRYLETNSSNPATMSAAVAASDKWNNDVVIEGDLREATRST